jgi:hypothetical protein
MARLFKAIAPALKDQALPPEPVREQPFYPLNLGKTGRFLTIFH